MIYIGICDDETIHQIKNRDCCEQFFSGKNIDHSYIFFHSIFDVLSYSSHHISVLLLDIEMNDSINGVQLMHRLQHSRFVGSIIFISSHTNYVYDSFSPKTIGFCPKPIKIERLFPLLESSLRSHCSNHPVSLYSLAYLLADTSVTLSFENVSKDIPIALCPASNVRLRYLL